MNYYSFARNSVNADIYLGQGAGKKLLNDMENAKKFIKIISPYHSTNYLELLILLQEKGIDISLITSEEIKDYKEASKGTLKTKLIKQEKTVNEKERKKHIVISKISKFSILGFVLSILIIFGLGWKISEAYFQGLYISIGLMAIGTIFFFWSTNIKVNTYAYKELFPFRVFDSPHKLNYSHSGAFHIHSKVYIIDDEIAYMGSINLTSSGLGNSFESRIRIIDKDVISGLNEMFEKLFNHTDNIFLDNIAWGKQAYAEPLN